MSTRISPYIKRQYPTTVYNRLRVRNPLAVVTNHASWAINMDKATGISPGINSPFTNPVIDLKRNANVTLTNFGATTSSGYTLEPFVTATGEQEVSLVNLLGNDGNMIDSNADNRADGWVYTSATPVSCAGNEVVFLPTAQFANIQATRVNTQGDILYLCAFVKSTNANTRLNSRNSSNGNNVSASHSGSGNYELLSNLRTVDVVTTEWYRIDTNATTGFSNITAKQAHLVNMTQVFPNPANRPTQAQMDSIMKQVIDKYGYVNTQLIRLTWRTMLKFDGTNDYGLAANHPNLDITGTGDFSIACVFKTGASLVSGYLAVKNLDSTASIQYGVLLVNTGSVDLYLNGAPISVLPVSTLQINTFYKMLVYRFNGRLKFRLFAIESYNQLNSVNITTRPHFRVGTRSNNVDGTAHNAFTNIALAHLSIINGAVTPFTEDQLIRDWDLFCEWKYGL